MNGILKKNTLVTKKTTIDKKEDDIIVKRKSPYLYNRTSAKKTNSMDRNTLQSRMKKETEQPIIELIIEEPKVNKEDVDILNKKLISLEKQLAIYKNVSSLFN
jgi:hypothetical protein